MTTIWSSVSLLLVMDKESLPKDSYTSPMVGRDGYSVLRPDPSAGQASTWPGAPPWC